MKQDEQRVADVCLGTAKSERVPTDLHNTLELEALLARPEFVATTGDPLASPAPIDGSGQARRSLSR
jgi:hypothetical protein